MICNNFKWRKYYYAIKKISSLLSGLTAKHDTEFFFLKFRNSFTTKNKLELYKKYIKINIFLVP